MLDEMHCNFIFFFKGNKLCMIIGKRKAWSGQKKTPDQGWRPPCSFIFIFYLTMFLHDILN